METIDKIQEELRQGILVNDPHKCAEYLSTLSGELSFYLAQMSEIEKNRPVKWLEIRKNTKSVSETDREYEMTEDGIHLEWFKSREKRIKALMTGLKAIIKNAESESRNQF